VAGRRHTGQPRGWLVRVASRKLLDRQRSQAARARREQEVALQGCADAHAPSADEARGDDQDDTVHLLLLCCHPGLSPVSQVALTLRAVAGLTTAQVAAGFLVPEATMAQRVSRAKATLRRAGARFERVPPEELPARLHAVRHVLYLLFNEGYTSSYGHCAIDPNLTREAIRLTERLHRAIPEDGESTGLLALMLLTAARTPARLTTTGDLVPLAEQDRGRWDADKIRRGTALLEQTLVAGPVGPFQLQAAIAGVHAQARTWAETDWLEICILYRMLNRQAPSPTVTLNLAIAVGMAHGPSAGLGTLDPLLHDASQQRNHRLHAARAHLLQMAGDYPERRCGLPGGRTSDAQHPRAALPQPTSDVTGRGNRRLTPRPGHRHRQKQPVLARIAVYRSSSNSTESAAPGFSGYRGVTFS